MLLRRITDFILLSRVRAIAVAFLIALIPWIGSVGVIVAAFVTLRKNAIEGLLVFVAATIPLLIHYHFAPVDSIQANYLFGMVGLVIVTHFVLWLYAVLLRQFKNWTLLIEISVVVGLVVVLSVHAFVPSIDVWWAKQLTIYFNSSNTFIDEAIKQKEMVPEVVQVKMIDSIKYYATGLVMISLFFNIFLQLLMARWWEAVIFRRGELRKELQSIRLSYFMAGLFFLMVILSFFKIDFVLDCAPVIYAGFAAAGLSLLHCLIQRQAKWLWMALLYFAIIWLFPFSLAMIAVIAFFDTILNFRLRVKKLVK